MKKLLAIIAFALTALAGTQALAWTQRQPFPVQNCQAHAPYGFPQTQRQCNPYANRHTW